METNEVPQQYISKSALVAEIEKCIYRCNEKKRLCPVNIQIKAICDNKMNAYNEILSFLDTLDVKEMDLEKEYKNFIKNGNGRSMFEIAKHFFELGLKAQRKA